MESTQIPGYCINKLILEFKKSPIVNTPEAFVKFYQNI